MPIKLFNQGKSSIQYGNEPEEVLKPKQTAAFKDDVAKKLIRLFPNDLINVDQQGLGQDEIAEIATARKKFEEELANAKKAITAEREELAAERAEIEKEKAAIEAAKKTKK